LVELLPRLERDGLRWLVPIEKEKPAVLISTNVAGTLYCTVFFWKSNRVLKVLGLCECEAVDVRFATGAAQSQS